MTMSVEMHLEAIIFGINSFESIHQKKSPSNSFRDLSCLPKKLVLSFFSVPFGQHVLNDIQC